MNEQQVNSQSWHSVVRSNDAIAMNEEHRWKLSMEQPTCCHGSVCPNTGQYTLLASTHHVISPFVHCIDEWGDTAVLLSRLFDRMGSDDLQRRQSCKWSPVSSRGRLMAVVDGIISTDSYQSWPVSQHRADPMVSMEPWGVYTGIPMVMDMVWQ